MSNWIAGAVGKTKGGFHRTLGLPKSHKITAADIARGRSMGGRAAKQANLASTLMGMHHKGPKRRMDPGLLRGK
jgi:hypothetical protein